MTDGDANQPPKRPMPWEPGAGEPASSDAMPPEPSDAAPPVAPPDATPTEVVQTPEAPPAAAGLISAAPVGWAAPAEPTTPTSTQWGATTDPIAPITAGAPDAPPPMDPAVGWATPAVSRRAIPGAPGLVFADTASRFVAWVIDVIIAGFLGFLIGGVIVGALVSSDSLGAGGTGGTGGSTVLLWVVVLLIDMAYFVFFWTGGRRATPGQRLLKLQVGNAGNGQNLGLTQAVLRWLTFGQWLVLLGTVAALSSLAGLIGFVWPFVLLVTTVMSPVKQGLHDRVAGTWVVKPADASNSGLIVGCLIVLVLLLVLPVLAIIGLIASADQLRDVLSAVGDSI